MHTCELERGAHTSWCMEMCVLYELVFKKKFVTDLYTPHPAKLGLHVANDILQSMYQISMVTVRYAVSHLHTGC